VDGSGNDIAFEACLHIPKNRTTIGAFPEPEDGKKHRLFERAKDVRHVCLYCRHSCHAECKNVPVATHHADRLTRLAADGGVGRFKAHFFAALGYAADEWQVLEADLRIQHLGHDADAGPNGQAASVLSVWFLRAETGIPHFVTAYPGGAS
jgi:hypothetical protein